MASPPATKKARVRQPCPYGAVCYRKNPAHFRECSHPGDLDHKPDSVLVAAVTTAASPSVGVTATTTPVLLSVASSLPLCKYGVNCTRKNLLHFAEFQHPYGCQGAGKTPAAVGGLFGGAAVGAAPATSSYVDDDGDDTDPCDSEDKGKAKATQTRTVGDALSRGLSLVKSYSQLTDEERKELMRKAFEAKQHLQQELEATRKQEEEKERQLSTLNEELETGTLLVEGEREAMDGEETVYFPLAAERQHKVGSAAEIHYRLAESQFYRLVHGHSQYRVTKVDYVVTPCLVRRFKAAHEKLKTQRGEEWSAPVLGFHGTKEEFITTICETGFKVPGEDGFQHKTDTGYYGAGVYFSEYPEYCMGYIQGGSKLLLCQVLLGRPFQCKKLIMGAKLQAGYDSHISPNKKELVVFSSHHILASYIVYYTCASGSEFSYKKARLSGRRKIAAQKSQVPVLNSVAGDIFAKRIVANNALLTDVFEGISFRFVGDEDDGKNLFQLLSKHKGKKGKGDHFDVVVAMAGVTEEKSKLVQRALEKDLPVVREEFVYECIIQKKMLDPDSFLHEIYDQ